MISFQSAGCGWDSKFAKFNMADGIRLLPLRFINTSLSLAQDPLLIPPPRHRIQNPRLREYFSMTSPEERLSLKQPERKIKVPA